MSIARFHFECLGEWLNPNGTSLHGPSVVESASGPVELDLRCPNCRHGVSRSTSRMLSAGRGRQ